MDLNMFNNKIDLTADYFIDTRKDLLIPGIPVSGILGTNGPGGGNPVQNAGTVRNSGFEFAIGYKEYINEDFNFESTITSQRCVMKSPRLTTGLVLLKVAALVLASLRPQECR